ncbi:TonB-dependent siderophore receptor [Stakelama sp. CBK3Z-3]|uniref:TonB-dependent siderophore receptor n=1 Tax=Stakelama flava TaxID=2860338 RepID=A0ABS6XHI0_9SPHN|nr:TonB-dependent siderophore receptor [Stakelama flava]MBW4329664.1 TonB-dependent siderophore receptor [Stakelama flava]
MSRFLIAAGISLVALSAPAYAADGDTTAVAPATPQDVGSSSTNDSGDIVVTGYRFLDADTSGITNLPLPIEKVPQSISLVNNDFVKAADLKNMGEIAQYTPGALWASYSPSYGNQLWLRGFAANYAVDGLLVGDQITDPDPATLERYELVKGPASVVYGAQSPGGVVNLVSKSAGPHTPSYVEALGGSWSRWRLEGQVAGALNASGTIRAIAVAAHEQGGSFVDFVHLNKTVLYGGLDVDVTPTLSGYLHVNYQRTEDTPYNGIPTFTDGSPVPVARSFLVGGSDFRALAQARRTDAGLTWRPSDLWSFDLKTVYQYTTHGGDNVYPYGFIATDGSFPINGEHFSDWRVYDFTVAGTTIRKLDDLGLPGSTLSASLRYQHYRYFISELNFDGGTANIFDGDQAVSDAFNALTPVPGGYEQDQRMNYLTGSAQAVIKVADPVTLVGGIAYSRPKVDQQVYDGAFQQYNPGNQLSYRAAAIVTPARGLNFYGSYSESYQPNLRIDVGHDVLPPVKGKQYEIGAKYLLGHHILLTGALFQIDESNVAVYDTMIDGEALYRAAGVRHRGAELEATGAITDHWQVKAGLALLDPRVTKDPEHPSNVGETRPWLPRSTADLYTSYALPNGISVGGGMRYMGAVKTYDRSSTPTPDLHAYTVFDTDLGYTIGHWHAQLNLKNLFDKHYYVGTPVFQSLSAGLYPGEPRSFAISLRREL